jgi:uncharacterized protein (TIGR03382 family)
MKRCRNSLPVEAALCTVVALGGLAASSAHADLLDVVLNDTNAADNFLYNNGATSNFAGSALFYYDNRQAVLDKARPLIRFDLPSLPAGSTITSVKLRLVIQQYTCIDVNNANAVVPYNYSVHQMLADWSETTSNWNERSAGNPWNTPGLGAGTDYNAAPAATTLVSTPSANNFINVPVLWDITSLYLDWTNGVAQNYGVHLHGQAGDPTRDTNGGDTTDGVFRAYNTEFGDDARRPHLLVEYIPAPGSVTALALGGLVLSRRRRTLA